MNFTTRVRTSSWFGGIVLFVTLATVMARGTEPANGEDHSVNCVEGMPAVVNPTNLYSEASVGHLSQAVGDALERVYVPEVRSNAVDVIDPITFKVVDQFSSGLKPQHVIPSWDLKTLWVAGSGRRHSP